MANKISFVFHAHVPIFSLNNERETVTFFEKLTDSYLPFFQMCEQLHHKVGLTITPTFLHMVEEETFKNQYSTFLEEKLALALNEEKKNQTALVYVNRYKRILSFWEEKHRSIVSIIKKLVKREKIVPLLKFSNSNLIAHFNSMWLKEAQIQYCIEKLETMSFWGNTFSDEEVNLLQKYSLENVNVDSITYNFSPIISEYVKDAVYRDKYNDIAFERQWSYLQAFFPTRMNRLNVGISYMANGSEKNSPLPYNEKKATERCLTHVQQFLQEVANAVVEEYAILNFPLELFGYEWDEGILFLSHIMENLTSVSSLSFEQQNNFSVVKQLYKKSWKANNVDVTELFELEEELNTVFFNRDIKTLQQLHSIWLNKTDDDLLNKKKMKHNTELTSFNVNWDNLFTTYLKRKDEKAHVLWLSTEFPPGMIGGLGTHVAQLSKTLQKRGVKIIVITIGAIGAPSFEIIEGVEVYRVTPFQPAGTTLIQWNSRINVAMIEQAVKLAETKSFSFIHAHDWLVCATATQLKSMWNVPLISTIHALEKGRRLGEKLKEDQEEIHRLEEKLTNASDYIIVCSDYMKQELIRHFSTPQHKITVIPNGVNDVKDNEVQPLNSTYPKIVAIGRLVPEKGFQYFIEAAAKVRQHYPNTIFILAGIGPYEKALKRKVQEQNVEDVVQFVGFLQEEQKKKLLQECDIVVVPSLYEPFGIVVLEAMAHSKVVIASNSGGIPSIITHEQNGFLINPGNGEEIARLICRVLTQGQSIKKIQENANKSMELFSWDIISEKTLHVYKNIQERVKIP